MILQLLRQLNNLDRSRTIACSASFCFGFISLRFPCPLPKRISSRILSKSMFIPQNYPKSQQRVRTCAVIEKPVFRASLALSMLEIELYQISLPYDRGRSGYEIKRALLLTRKGALTAVKRKSMRNALVPGRRLRIIPAQISLKPLQNRCYGKKRLNDSD